MTLRTVVSQFSLLSVLALPAYALAQTTPPPPPKQEGSIDVAFVGTSGNTSTSTLSAGLQHVARPTNWLIKNNFLAIRGSVNGDVTANSLLYAFRTERTINRRTAAFGEY